jgi:hypothetical protein
MKFNIKKLVKLLDADTATILADPKKYWDYKVQKGKNYLYIDRGANILGVAHLDTVADTVKPNDKKNKFEKTIVENVGVNDIIVTSIKLDDRLGVFLLMDVLPYLGLKYDILLTTDEEIGMSTASNFKTKKKYNWVFSMDRRDYGTAVLYQYGTPEITNALKSLDYKIETGSFSDISELDQLGCAGINFGCGYKYEHTNSCMMRTSWLSVVVNMFVDFYGWYNDVKFNYVYKPTSRYSTYSYGKYSDFSYWGSSATVKSTNSIAPTKKYEETTGEWKELLSDKYDDEIVEMVKEELSVQTIPVEIIPVNDSDYTYPPYYKNGIKITAYALEANGDWTAMGTDSDGNYYTLGVEDKIGQDTTNPYLQPQLSFEREEIDDIIDKHVSTMLKDDDDFDYYLKHDSRAKNPKSFLHPEDFDEPM